MDGSTRSSRKLVSVHPVNGAQFLLEDGSLIPLRWSGAEHILSVYMEAVSAAVSAGLAQDYRVESDGRMKINWEEKSRSLFHQYGRYLLATLVVVLLVHDIFGTHGFLAMQHKRQEIQKVRTQLDFLNKENAVLEQERTDLKTDPRTIERIARDEMGMGKTGEIIIKLPALPSQAPPAAKP